MAPSQPHRTDTSQPVVETVLKCVLVSDLVDSTKLAEQLGDVAMAEIFLRHDRLARDLLHAHGGREADRTDGFLMLFDRPFEAVRYALAFHRAMDQLARDVGVELGFRVGIHLGEIILIETAPEDVARGAKPLEVEGLAKPTAARLMSLAQARQTLLSQAAFDLSRRSAVGADAGADKLRWMAHGDYLLKGVSTPIEVFEVGEEGFAPLTAPPDTEKVRRVVGDATILGWRPAAGLEIPRRPSWVLRRKLGEGGFGEVWLARHQKTRARQVFKFCFEAERLKGLRREIALFRVLKDTLGERDDIAHILDWNFDEPPYFIESEYTAGGNLAEWAEREGGPAQIPLATRLELVAQIAAALAAAHSVGVLHKDVKPFNVLIHTDVAGQPRARLTDFGIGLLTDESRLAAAGVTVLGMTELSAEESSITSGTRLYTAPEVLEGKAPSIQADVYALGVILYQLLVGDFTRAVAPGWERDVDDELLRALLAATVDGDPGKRFYAGRVAAELRDLEARRARLAAERRERQEAERNRLALERARKRRKVALAAFAVLALVAGGTGLLARRIFLEKERADHEAESARQVSDFLVNLFQDSDPQKARGETITAREILDQGVARLRAGELVDQPLIQARLRDTVGGIYRRLGLYAPAETLLEEALATRRELLGERTLEVADSLNNLGRLYREQGRYAEAEKLYRESLAVRETLLGADDEQVAVTLNNIAHLKKLAGDFAGAAELYQRCRAILEESRPADDPQLAVVFGNLATVYLEQGKYREAEPFYQRALAIDEKNFGADHPDVAWDLDNLAVLYRLQHRFAEAEPLARRALAIREQVAEPSYPEVAKSLVNLATLYLEQGRFAEAEPLVRRALATQEQVLGVDHPDLATTLENLARAVAGLRRPAEAEELLLRAQRIREGTLGGDHPDVGKSLVFLANLYRDTGRYAEAEALYQRADGILRATLGPGHPDVAQLARDRAELERARSG